MEYSIKVLARAVNVITLDKSRMNSHISKCIERSHSYNQPFSTCPLYFGIVQCFWKENPMKQMQRKVSNFEIADRLILLIWNRRKAEQTVCVVIRGRNRAFSGNKSVISVWWFILVSGPSRIGSRTFSRKTRFPNFFLARVKPRVLIFLKFFQMRSLGLDIISQTHLKKFQLKTFVFIRARKTSGEFGNRVFQEKVRELPGNSRT